ncbi:MAG TPA: DUF3795 domain-containing protein [Spirochaetota bacterium]|nr:DUF3795 domain-containing protein [Spirochaetota bacterium]
MDVHQEWLAPCGLYCGVCSIMIADRNNDLKFKEKLSPAYGVPVEQLTCGGCLSENPFVYCRVCPIKTCTREKGYEGCHQCADFPCAHVAAFPVEVGKKEIMRAVPLRRKLATEQWVEAEERRYQCASCGEMLFRGARRCRNCGCDFQPVEMVPK